MAIEIREKDRLFVAVLAPVLAVCAYWWGWRADASRRIAALEEERARLVTAEEFPMRIAAAERDLESAKAELAAERARPRPEERVKSLDGVSFADRESDVLNVFREAGLDVLRSETPAARPGAANAKDALQAASHGDPKLRRYVVEGAYPAVKRALDAFSARRMPVVPERVEMAPAGDRVRWTMEVWL